ncbi:MAG: HAD family phosphatase [Chloroflexia bacterium]|nr:HAD family phosphatase [Chloroflexia bacterium]
MPYRLLALDLDGTLIGPDLVISETVKHAISRAKAQGITVTVATSRVFSATLPFIKDLGIDDPIICYQGALVRHPVSREIYDHTSIPCDLAVDVIERLQQSGIFVMAFIDGKTCVTERRPELNLYLSFHPGGETDVVIEPELIERVRHTPPTKLQFVADPLVVDQELATLSAHFTDTLSIVRSHAHFDEITAPGITKGAALASLAARLGIASEDVIAIGDQENDVSILIWAGLGLAMGNAPAEVREVADAIIPPVTDSGVAWAIENYLLNDEVRYRNVNMDEARTGEGHE